MFTTEWNCTHRRRSARMPCRRALSHGQPFVAAVKVEKKMILPGGLLASDQKDSSNVDGGLDHAIVCSNEDCVCGSLPSDCGAGWWFPEPFPSTLLALRTHLTYYSTVVTGRNADLLCSQLQYGDCGSSVTGSSSSPTASPSPAMMVTPINTTPATTNAPSTESDLPRPAGPAPRACSRSTLP